MSCPICGGISGIKAAPPLNHGIPWQDAFAEGFLLGIFTERIASYRGQVSHLLLCAEHLKQARAAVKLVHERMVLAPDALKALNVGLHAVSK